MHTPLPRTPPAMHAPTMHHPATHSPCHAHPPPHIPPAMHAQHHAPPTMHTPPTTHAPAMHAPTIHPPCHTCPPTIHVPLPCTPPTTHAPCHAPPCHACLPCGQNSWHMLLKILPCPNFVAGGKNQKRFKWWPTVRPMTTLQLLNQIIRDQFRTINMKSNPSERSTLDTGILYPFIESSCADSDHDALIAITTTPGYSGLSEIITFTHRKLITRPNFAILGPVHSKRQRERKRKRSKYKQKSSKNKRQRSKKIFVFASVFFFFRCEWASNVCRYRKYRCHYYDRYQYQPQLVLTISKVILFVKTSLITIFELKISISAFLTEVLGMQFYIYFVEAIQTS